MIYFLDRNTILRYDYFKNPKRATRRHEIVLDRLPVSSFLPLPFGMGTTEYYVGRTRRRSISAVASGYFYAHAGWAR